MPTLQRHNTENSKQILEIARPQSQEYLKDFYVGSETGSETN
jgi:hypothetical protein